ncbi:MAG: YqaJ viral recombinase family protein [Alphaproteobacteria bacterium]
MSIKEMIIRTIQQGSDEWHAARCGVVTASNFKAILTKGSGKTRANYMRRLAEEIMTGRVAPPSFESKAMQRGNDLEPYARNAYQEKTGRRVREVGIAYLDESKRVAASPDGLISDDGGLEIKCPLPHTHEKYWQDGRAMKPILSI